MTKYITFTDKNGVSKTVSTRLSVSNTGKVLAAYPQKLQFSDLTHYSMAVHKQIGYIAIRMG
jgi:hypothetical protein